MGSSLPGSIGSVPYRPRCERVQLRGARRRRAESHGRERRSDADPHLSRLTTSLSELQRDGTGKSEPRGDGALPRPGSRTRGHPCQRNLRRPHSHSRRVGDQRVPQASRPRSAGRAASTKRIDRRRGKRGRVPLFRPGSGITERSPASTPDTTSSARRHFSPERSPIPLRAAAGAPRGASPRCASARRRGQAGWFQPTPGSEKIGKVLAVESSA